MDVNKLEGKSRVDQLLLEPLEGLGRRKGISAEKHEAMLKRLRERLAYMSDQSLRAMEEIILRHAGKGVWPAEGLIKTWAFDLQLPPPSESDYAQSLIGSAMGRQARAEGWVVELFQIAKRLGPPPNRYILYKLKEKAADNQRDLRRISENIQAGLATYAERQWLAAWQADMAEIEAIQSARASTDRGAA